MAATARRIALKTLLSRTPVPARTDPCGTPLASLFGCDVFNDQVMREKLSKDVYQALRRTIERGDQLDAGIADHVANAMKTWAIEKGATHFTHWFQPMTGHTAEKHDGFLSLTAGGRAILEFSGRELIKGEPDASSFPSGGIRTTFEARGYTAWDPTSPAFVRRSTSGSTLCIPTAFCSWTGEALDKKTPLLRSCEAITTHAVRMLRLLGNNRVTRVMPTLGAEQEYFLIDRAFHLARPDLVASGRTLFGARPPKGQELEDHYFGSINERVLSFMMDIEHELWRLGVPIKTRHNEVAPAQFEVAPIFENVILATDHNMLTMEVMKAVAARHGLVCLLHEKPFAGINGSGKHNNWSLADDAGNNLLEPGSTPHANLQFMIFLTAVIRAVDLHGDLLRASVAHAGNDHRLGANEAPPAIISIFLGEALTDVVNSLADGTTPAARDASASRMSLGVMTLPPLPKDLTDRNRTSPFAFTGNKFEFRAVGSSQSIALPNITLNTIVAESLDFLATEIERRRRGDDVTPVIQEVLAETLRGHRRILFGGNNYSEEWQAEAERRGLPNHRNTVDALAVLGRDDNMAIFAQYGVFSRRESQARARIACEAYVKAIAIEAQSASGIAATAILPVAVKHERRLAEAILATRQAVQGADLAAQETALREVASLICRLRGAVETLQDAAEKAEKAHGEPLDHARLFRDTVVPAIAKVREIGDRLETIVDDDLWPLPKYREMLFTF